ISSSCFELPALNENGSAASVEPTHCELRPTANSTINQLLDLATSNVVQFLNNIAGEPVVREVVIDYIVDCRSQLWMLWVDRAVLTSDTDGLADETDPAQREDPNDELTEQQVNCRVYLHCTALCWHFGEFQLLLRLSSNSCQRKKTLTCAGLRLQLHKSKMQA